MRHRRLKRIRSASAPNMLCINGALVIRVLATFGKSSTRCETDEESVWLLSALLFRTVGTAFADCIRIMEDKAFFRA